MPNQADSLFSWKWSSGRHPLPESITFVKSIRWTRNCKFRLNTLKTKEIYKPSLLKNVLIKKYSNYTYRIAIDEPYIPKWPADWLKLSCISTTSVRWSESTNVCTKTLQITSPSTCTRDSQTGNRRKLPEWTVNSASHQPLSGMDTHI